eukprot:gene1868-2110_t
MAARRIDNKMAANRKNSAKISNGQSEDWICTLCDQKFTEDKAEMLESSANDSSAMDEQISEFRESESRKRNIIIFNINESEKTDPKQHKEDDTQFVDELCNIMGIEPSSVAAVTRLGRRVTKEQDKGDAHNQE